MRKHPLLAFATTALIAIATLSGFVAQQTDQEPNRSSHPMQRAELVLDRYVAPLTIKPATQHRTKTDLAVLRRRRALALHRRALARRRRRLVHIRAEARLRRSQKATVAPLGGVWQRLRDCESAGNYAEDSGNGYYGAYQFALATWHSIGEPGFPNEAPPAVQDRAAERLQALDGWRPWPSCSVILQL